MKGYKVSDLLVGDVFWINEALMVVKSVLTDKVLVCKITASNNSMSVQSVSASSPYYEDLKNRVKLASQSEVDEYLRNFKKNSEVSRKRFMEGFKK